MGACGGTPAPSTSSGTTASPFVTCSATPEKIRTTLAPPCAFAFSSPPPSRPPPPPPRGPAPPPRPPPRRRPDPAGRPGPLGDALHRLLGRPGHHDQHVRR